MDIPRIIPKNDPVLERAIMDLEEMKKKRQRGLRCLRKLSIVIGLLAVLALVCGSLAIYFGSPVYRFPFSFPGAIIVGFVMLIGSMVGCSTSCAGRHEIETSGQVRCLIVAFYVLCMIGVIFGIMCAAISVWAIIACETEGDMHVGCLPNIDENLAFAGLNVVFGILLAILSLSGACFFCCYGRAFGLKSRWERRLESQISMMSRQRDMQEQGNVQLRSQVQDQSNTDQDQDSDIDVQRF
ncbi:hypothetical protein ScPMuIL_018888 [Solemya velum]